MVIQFDLKTHFATQPRPYFLVEIPYQENPLD